MSVIAHFSVPAEQFPLGDVLEVRRGVEVCLESMIPTGGDVVPYIWVGREDADAVEEALRQDPLIAVVERLEETDDDALFRVGWAEDVDGLVSAVASSPGVVLEAQGSGDGWTFVMRFPEHDHLASFYRNCVDQGVSLSVTEVNNLLGSDDARGFNLTQEQREALLTALEAGYFAVPRQITLVELAERLGISDTAVSQRIQRGLASLLSSTLQTRAETTDSRSRPSDNA